MSFSEPYAVAARMSRRVNTIGLKNVKSSQSQMPEGEESRVRSAALERAAQLTYDLTLQTDTIDSHLATVSVMIARLLSRAQHIDVDDAFDAMKGIVLHELAEAYRS